MLFIISLKAMDFQFDSKLPWTCEKMDYGVKLENRSNFLSNSIVEGYGNMDSLVTKPQSLQCHRCNTHMNLRFISCLMDLTLCCKVEVSSYNNTRNSPACKSLHLL